MTYCFLDSSTLFMFVLPNERVTFLGAAFFRKSSQQRKLNTYEMFVVFPTMETFSFQGHCIRIVYKPLTQMKIAFIIR